jgi:hypothetical protein
MRSDILLLKLRSDSAPRLLSLFSSALQILGAFSKLKQKGPQGQLQSWFATAGS